jgi:hypothetical protein
VDFEDFEVRDGLPNLPKIKVSCFHQIESEEDLELNPALLENEEVLYFDSTNKKWDYDEGVYFLPLFNTCRGSDAKLYHISIKFSETSFLQSVKFHIGVYQPYQNSVVALNTRIPYYPYKNQPAVLRFPLEYNNKPQVVNRENNEMNSIDCGVEWNVGYELYSTSVTLKIFAENQDNEVSRPLVDKIFNKEKTRFKSVSTNILGVNSYTYNLVKDYSGFSVPYGTKSLRVEINVLPGKIRIVCQDVEGTLDLKSWEKIVNGGKESKWIKDQTLAYKTPDYDENKYKMIGKISSYSSTLYDTDFDIWNCGIKLWNLDFGRGTLEVQ